jgi:hypothetical protein
LKRAAEELIELTEHQDVKSLYDGSVYERLQPVGLISSRPTDGRGYTFVDNGPETIQLYI